MMKNQKVASAGAAILFCDVRRDDRAPSKGTVPAMAGKYEGGDLLPRAPGSAA